MGTADKCMEIHTMNSNDTAQRLLSNDYTIICEAIETAEQCRHVEAMARLWLMRDEIQQFVEDTINAFKVTVDLAHRAGRPDIIDNFVGNPDFKRMSQFLAKIKAVEKNNE